MTTQSLLIAAACLHSWYHELKQSLNKFKIQMSYWMAVEVWIYKSLKNNVHFTF